MLLPGVLTYVVGANGSGKSTLAAVLAKQLPGEVRWHEVNGGNGRDKQPRTALVRQNALENLAGGVSVRDNLRARRRPTRLRERVFPRLFGEPLSATYPSAESLVVGKEKSEVSHLSGGQQQLLAMAAVAAQECDVLILDEYQSGVDMVVRESIGVLVRAHASRGGATLVISHDLVEVARCASLVYVLTHGMVSAVLDKSEGDITRDALENTIRNGLLSAQSDERNGGAG